MKKRFLSLLLCAVMVCGFIPQGTAVFAASADDGLCDHHRSHTEECGYNEGVTESSCNYVCPICSESESDGGDVLSLSENSVASVNDTEYDSLAKAITEAAQSGDTVVLLQDVAFGEGKSVEITGNVVLDLNGFEISNSLQINSDILEYDYCSSKDAVRPIQIVSGGRLTLKDSKADSEKAGNIKNGVLVSKGGTFVMESGSISNSEYLNGVTNSGTFTMNGGTISKNRYVGPGNHGGGVSNLGGTFVMNGGRITENLCYGYGETKGGGVYNTGSFTINNGEISNNSIESYKKAYRCVGGGVSIYTDDYNGQSSFIMTGGKICDNKAVDYDPDYDDYRGHGGGVHIEGAQNNSQINATFQMTGGEISGNTSALSGGGIYISNNARVDITEGKISNNEALTSSGGGISIYNTSIAGGGTWGLAPGELHMKNVVITGNTATNYKNYGSYGGGIATCPTSQTYVYLTDGGAIYGNTSSNGELLAQKIKPELANQHLLYLSGYMLGGGAYNWTDLDGKSIETNQFMDLASDDFIATNSVTEDSAEAKMARSLAKVFITGNKACYTGGGIMNNGILEIGTSDASLRVEKKVVNGIQSSPYKFTVSLWTEDEKGEKTPYDSAVTYLGSRTDGVKKEDTQGGKLSFELAKGDYIVFCGLSDGVHYEVEETSSSNYETDYGDKQKGVLSQRKMTNVVVTNTHPTGTLTIAKKVTGDADADKEKEFEFELTLFDENNKPIKNSELTLSAVVKVLSWNVVEQETPLSLTDQKATRAALKPTEATSTIKLQFNEDGTATFKLSDGEDIKITLPVGTHYKIVETQASQEGYKATIEGDSEGTITKAGENKTIVFTNTKNIETSLQSSLTVEKKVTGTHGDKDKEFHFTVELEDKTISSKYGDMTFKDGVASFTLKDGERRSAVGLPAGVKYTVAEKEANRDGYTTSSSNEEGRIPANGNVAVTFTNTKNIETSLQGSLTVEKKVTGTHGDKDKEFHFTVELEDKTISGKYGDMTFKDGVASFTLKHGERRSAVGLPAGVKYTVAEKEANGDGYTTSSTNEEGRIPANDYVVVKYINQKETEADEPNHPSTPDEPNNPNTPDNPDKPGDKNTETDTVKTGDQANIGLYTVLLVTSALCITILAIWRRKIVKK